MPTRRTFLGTMIGAGAAATAIGALPPTTMETAPAAIAPGHRIDTLVSDDGAAPDVAVALAGGMTAAVVDLAVGPRTYENAVRELGRWSGRFVADTHDVLSIRTTADFARARQEKKLGIVLACQDATIVGSPGSDYASTLHFFHTLGLRVLQLTHNQRTHWADSFMEKRDGGLSRSGERLVSLMNDLGILVDLSHCSPQTLLDTTALAKKPPIVTHAGCRALAPTARNKSDDEIRALGRANGFFGVYNMTVWLTNGPTGNIDTVVAHIDHVAQLIGADKVGYGSDGGIGAFSADEIATELARMARVQKANEGGPSAEWPVLHVRAPELRGGDRMLRLAEALSKRGYSDADVDGIAGTNFVRVFQRAIG